MKNKHYKLQLKNGEEVIIDILEAPVYQCEIFGDANIHYRTAKEIRKMGKAIGYVGWLSPNTLMQKHVGYITDEGVLFSIYRSLRNPIVKLELYGQKTLPFIIAKSLLIGAFLVKYTP